MSLLIHEFFADTHEYIVPGRQVISTSDVIQLAGLSNFDGIPKAVLDNARWRGQQVDLAIKGYEKCLLNGTEEYALNWIYDQMEGDLAEIRLQFEAYRVWRYKVQFEPIFPIDQSFVYELNDDILIGATPDLCGTLINLGRRVPAIVDIKCTSRLYGMKLEQKKLAWGLQLESYLMAKDMDDTFLYVSGYNPVGSEDYHTVTKLILQLNPVFKETGYMEHPFETDDRDEWIGLAISASKKIKAGILPEKR